MVSKRTIETDLPVPGSKRTRKSVAFIPSGCPPSSIRLRSPSTCSAVTPSKVATRANAIPLLPSNGLGAYVSAIVGNHHGEQPLFGPFGGTGERDLRSVDVALGHRRLSVPRTRLHVHSRVARRGIVRERGVSKSTDSWSHFASHFQRVGLRTSSCAAFAARR